MPLAIPAWLAIAGFSIGVLGLVFKNALAKKIAGAFPLVNANLALMILLVVGFIGGGAGLIWGSVSGFAGGLDLNTASVAADSAEGVLATSLTECVYRSGTGLTGNQTIRTDPSASNRIFIDIDGTEYDTYLAAGNINVTWSCTRSGATDKAASVRAVATGETFRAETSTTDSALYAIATQNASSSSVFSGKYKQTVYLNSGSQATASSSQESEFVAFAEGAKKELLGSFVTVDRTGFQKLNNYTQKTVTISQRTESGQDSPVAYIVVNKIP